MCSKFSPEASFKAAIAAFVEGEITVLDTKTTFPFLAAICFNLEAISASTSAHVFSSFPLYGPVKRAESYNGRTEANI